jgi:hypothetical protein
MAANPNPLYHHEPEPPKDDWRMVKALALAVPLGAAMWVGLIYGARWIWHIIWIVWEVWV